MNDVTHDTKVAIDPITGTPTTGHEWDGLQELNTPLPRWWLWLFYATIIWAIGYWIVYPAWPFITSYSQGVFGWHSRNAIVSDLDGLRAQRGPMMQKLAALRSTRSSPIRSSWILPARSASRLSQRIALPVMAPAALAPRAIPTSMTTIGSGAASSRTSSKRSRMASVPLIRTLMPGALMPAFGRTGMLKPAEISAAADYVRSLIRTADAECGSGAGQEGVRG